MAAYKTGELSKGIQLISYDGQLMPKEQIRAFLLNAVGKLEGSDALCRAGVNYHVVGIFGGQSGGKSTLMNCLFNTDFKTMDETKRRGQTTKGAFIARAESFASLTSDNEQIGAAANGKGNDFVSSPLFVLDFEGTDGIERGENQIFERKLSLFGLSVADILVINMWAVDVGRFNAANMSLLRTIFEVNLQLFLHESYEKEEKPTLLLLLRDFVEDDPSHYFETLRNSFDKMWGNIVKPDKFKNSKIYDFFELNYHVLPHYKLMRESFDAAIVEFRKWFFVPTNENNLFRGRGMLRNVPLDGIPDYMSNCWEMICSSKDLDIPTQREMLARHRCMESKSEAMKKFQEFCTECETRLNSGDFVPHLTKAMESKVEELVAEFGVQTKLYNAAIVQTCAAELKNELVAAELKVLDKYAKAIATTAVAGLDARIGQACDRTLNWLTQRAASLPLESKDGDNKENGGVGDYFKLNNAENNTSSDLVPNNEKCNELVRAFWEKLCSVLYSEMGLSSFGNEEEFKKNLSNNYGKHAAYVAEDAVLQEMVAQSVLDTVLQKVFYRFASMAENAAETIHRAFERILTHGSGNTVRFFSTAKGLQSAEPKASQAALVFLGCLLYYRLKLVSINTMTEQVKEGVEKGFCDQVLARLINQRRKLVVRDNTAEKAFFFNYTALHEVPRYPTNVPITATAASDNNTSSDAVDGSCVLLSQQALQRAFDVYKQKCEFTMQMQYRSINSVQQSIPLWLIPVILVLGWNEIWYVLTSPLLLIGVIFLASFFLRGIIAYQWELFQETGPAWIVTPLSFFFGRTQNAVGKFFSAFGNYEKHDEQ